ncbi:ATP-binding protein [Streptomyces sp. NPDC014006]|uniref:ATP-binding protein n=1 Tax=Streptomyces sp. NPDC014006 TaxID=3364870 RepID=UPI0036FB9D7D
MTTARSRDVLARKYAPGPVMLDLRILGDTMEIVVWDSDPVRPLPGPRTPAVWDSTVWRLCCCRPGLRARREPVGKRITARLALADDPGGALNGRSPL